MGRGAESAQLRPSVAHTVCFIKQLQKMNVVSSWRRRLSHLKPLALSLLPGLQQDDPETKGGPRTLVGNVLWEVVRSTEMGPGRFHLSSP